MFDHGVSHWIESLCCPLLPSSLIPLSILLSLFHFSVDGSFSHSQLHCQPALRWKEFIEYNALEKQTTFVLKAPSGSNDDGDVQSDDGYCGNDDINELVMTTKTLMLTFCC